MPRGGARLSPDPLRVALVGCGVMGTRHARTVAADPRSRLEVVVDTAPERAAALAERHGARVLDHVPTEVDAVVVATPTVAHADVALPLLARGAWCLVEKPLAHTLAAATPLVGPRCAVGHVERFNPAVRAAGPLRPVVVEGRRIAPPTGRGLDVDVILDLMIHDLDLVLSWGDGAEVAWVDAAGVVVEGADGRPTIDTASVRLRTVSGLTASLVASRVATERQRVLSCYEPGRCTRLDLLAGTAVRSGPGGVETLPAADGRDALAAQWTAFSGAVRGDRPGPVSTGDDGLRAIALADRIRESILSGRAS